MARLVKERNRSKDKTQFTRRTTSAHGGETESHNATVVKPTEPPPETPAPLDGDLFSPLNSEPSAPRQESQDTPPPADLGPDTGTGSFGRTSRRPRGAVNYAQPNLRDKMRRPTAELIDAVGIEERARQAKAEGESSNVVFIKQEDSADALPVWKSKVPPEGHRPREEPTSPLVNKTALTSDLPSTIITDRRRRTIVPTRNGDIADPTKPPSGASSTIAALTVRSQKVKRTDGNNTNADEDVEDDLDKKVERLSIYDFTGSSPANARSDHAIEESAVPTRSSRRHSSVPALSENGKGSIIISRRGDRRRQSVLDGEHKGSTERADERPPHPRSVTEPSACGEDVAMGRGERAASRRRSMML